MAHLSTAGEIVLFDRRWYNRAGVEHVIGFCSDSCVALPVLFMLLLESLGFHHK